MGSQEQRPYFETVTSFADVPITDDGVVTRPFLEASDGLVKLFDLLGSGLWAFVQNDIKSNISGVRDRFEGNEPRSGTLEELVLAEAADGHRYATQCLVRLVRGLTFLCRALQHMQAEQSLEMHACFKRAYDEVLRHQHGFVVRSLAMVAVRAAPARSDFIGRVSQGSSGETFDRELNRWLSGLAEIAQHTRSFLEQGGHGKV
ncbi:glycolipid transfer protein [Coniophora puteana RWD-64-598 SS2]|uniref:Glycolipid transfer protein n=1 Tax=Coniophora puteana (strain RWD-64-598) TaxID=741705 RepID=A0A5M3M8Y6_CONPW|nr:glycolipid transfer protein [Coniophora puteana RWD-64-598 SS2]EIW75304.1 glycolipid transfer protein [Coniophora puteana RWD-64-598 SS2]